MWLSLIFEVLKFLGPLILRWLQDRFKRAAESMPPAESFASEHEAREALFAHVLAGLPARAKRRRHLVERLRDQTRACGVTSAGAMRVPSADEAARTVAIARGAPDTK